MNAEQQKDETHHGDGGTGGTRTPEPGRQQTFTAFDQQRALTTNLMEQVCDPKNIVRAYRRVRSNKGKPGVDGMTVYELADWLRNNLGACHKCGKSLARARTLAFCSGVTTRAC
jgi:hypothetical protein